MKFTIIICLLSLLALAKTTIAQRDPPYLYSSDGKMINSYHFTNNGDPFMGFNQTEISYKPRVLYKIVSATVDENIQALVSWDNHTQVSLTEFSLDGGYARDIASFYLAPFTASNIAPTSFGYDAQSNKVYFVASNSSGYIISTYLCVAQLGVSKTITTINLLNTYNAWSFAQGSYDVTSKTYFAMVGQNTKFPNYQAISYNTITGQQGYVNVTGTLINQNTQIVAGNGQLYLVQGISQILIIYQADFVHNQIIAVGQFGTGWSDITTINLSAIPDYLIVSTNQVAGYESVDVFPLKGGFNIPYNFFFTPNQAVNGTHSLTMVI